MEKTMRVEIDGLGGASGTIVAECPGFNAAYHLAKAALSSQLVFNFIRIIDRNVLLAEWL